MTTPEGRPAGAPDLTIRLTGNAPVAIEEVAEKHQITPIEAAQRCMAWGAGLSRVLNPGDTILIQRQDGTTEVLEFLYPPGGIESLDA